jgi:hypothetical protein
MWFTVFIHSLIYIVAMVAALFLILALQVFLRSVGLSEALWKIFPHSFVLEPSGRPRVGFKKRLILFLGTSYLIILAGLTLLALR